jgi:DNA replication protein DnaC
MFRLVSDRYERAPMVVTSNKPFSASGEIFGDDMAATAMIDSLIHHAEILSLKVAPTHESQGLGWGEGVLLLVAVQSWMRRW